MIKETSLGTICDIYSAGDKPKCFSKISLGLNNVPVYGNGRDNSGLVGFTDKATMTSPAVTVAARGSSCGATFYRDTPYTPIVRLISLIAKSGIDTKYLYYQVCNRHFKGSGSGQPQITIPDIADAPIYLETDILIQKKIADVLYTIDSKISNNASICADLEGMAKLLYDYWFVQFNFPDENGKPYKSSGGKMVWNEELKREIPDGWNLTTIGDITICHDSERVPVASKDRETMKGNIPYYGATGIMGYVNSHIFDGDYVLMAEDGSIMDDKGYPILQRISGKTWVNNHAHVLEAIKGYSCKMLLMMFKDIPVRLIKTGSIQMKINQDNMNAYKLIDIPETIKMKIQAILDRIDEQQIALQQENQNLASLRDFLLPMLMNGQVKVGKSETE